MEIEIWDGGLQEHEAEAIRKIGQAFSNTADDRATLQRGGSLRDQLAASKLGRDSMFPWKGYAGFRFVDAKGKEGEFDLVIITHCNIIIVELKDWNHEPITVSGDNWFKGDKNMGRSPVTVTRNKQFLLDNKLKRYSSKFTNKHHVPRVHFFVVMTGNADFSKLPEVERKHTLSIQDFLRFSDKVKFNNEFRPHPDAQVLNKDFPIFDELFGKSNTAPKTLRIGGYTAVEPIFEHPNSVYKEYLATSEISKNKDALLRLWDFKKLDGNKAITSQGRAEIVSREREVLQFINYQNRDLYNHCLRSLTGFERDEVTSQYSEVYELPPGHVRFNEFVGKYGQSFSMVDRLNLTKLLIAKFADLHAIKIAHRDIADHSLWLSPSKEIALSNFISAYHQPIGTVGDYRASLSVGAAEIKDMLEGASITPFQRDVHALGLVAWHLLSAKRMSPKTLESIEGEILASSDWYTGVLVEAVTAKFRDAAEFFDALKRAEPQAESIPTFDDFELDAYRHPINLTRQFPDEGDFLVETHDKEVYYSSGRLVKAWLNVGGKGDAAISNFRVLNFLKQLDKLSTVNPICLPRIHEYGLASKSNSMYLVTDIIDGVTWANMVSEDEAKIGLIEKLTDAVEYLHGLGITHGDLHPENVMVANDGSDIYLIDMPDFCHNSEEAKNHRYSPENIDSSSSQQRDNFAAMRMSCELLGIEWAAESNEYPRIAEAVQYELSDLDFGFRDLGRFKQALKTQNEAPKQELIKLILSGIDESLTIFPDNGHLYVKVEKPKLGKTDYAVTFSGIGGSFVAFYDKAKKGFVGALPPRVRSDVTFRVAEESQFEINRPIFIKPGRPTLLSDLSDYLSGNEAFSRAIELLEFVQPEIDESKLSNQLKDIFEKADESVDKDFAEVYVDISTQSLWRAILDTETESNPNIELNGTYFKPLDNDNELIIPYEADVDPLGAFVSTDEVEALIIDRDGTEKVIGEVLLKKTALNEVRLNKIRSAAYALKDGDSVYFRTKQDRASYRKRKAALERLLDKEAVLPALVDYFDPGCKEAAIHYNISVNDEDFARYEREDKHGNRVSLNEQQREAFSKLLNYGPLSLLQGPPGTGKTEFISAFVHFLVEKLDVRRILLVSQSHEAVNTAAERIRKHCNRLGTELEVVRFSNREGAVSDGLKDVYSHAITAEKRELFNAEYRYRVATFADALGLDPEFISTVVDAELKLFKQIDHLEAMLNSLQNIDDEIDLKALKKISVEMDNTIRTTLYVDYGISLSKENNISEAKSLLISKLCSEYNVRPSEVRRVRALAKISRDMQEALTAERVNLDEFYARSRQLVTGTCVGIGQGHIGIHDNIYDFVIIDEAARSIASELAIAIQSAKRVLLVGDHLQLPPLYSDAHKAALARKLGINDKHADLDEILRSDFARAFNSDYGKQTSATLLTQYRMAPSIGDLVSKTFYDGKLVNGPRLIPDIYKGAPEALRSSVTWLDTSSFKEKANHQDDRGVSIYNRCEADQIIEVLKQISLNEQFQKDLENFKDKGEALIGVICMYAEQKRLLRQKFNQAIWSEGFKELVKIDTVDSYQGKENRIIILSLTRSDKQRSPGFLRAPNRINVAMSRAMDRLLIVGNAEMWTTHNKDKPLGKVVAFMTEMGEQNGYKFLAVQKKKTGG